MNIPARATWPAVLQGPLGEVVVVAGHGARARRALADRARVVAPDAITLDLSSTDGVDDAHLLAFDARPSALEREAWKLTCADAVDDEALAALLATAPGRRRARLARLLSVAIARAQRARGALLVVVEGDDDDCRFAARLRFLLRLVADQGARAVLLARRDAPEPFADRVVVVDVPRVSAIDGGLWGPA